MSIVAAFALTAASAAASAVAPAGGAQPRAGVGAVAVASVEVLRAERIADDSSPQATHRRHVREERGTLVIFY